MIHVIIGTKAQLIKMSPILKVLTEKNITYNHIATGQHQATMDDILDNFGLKPADICLYQGKDITSMVKMLFWFMKILLITLFKRKKIFKNDKKNQGIVLVHGDTMSTVLGALMAKIAGLKVAHVESGLRSFNIWQPFPEELSRLAVFRLADYLFCAGDWAMQNVSHYKNKTLINTQLNTLYDALRWAKISDTHSAIPNKPFAIVTLHRFENFNKYAQVDKIVKIIEKIAENHYLLFILHKPTEKNLKKYQLLKRLQQNPQIECRQRLDYFSFIALIHKAQFLISDGGSNQEECYYLGKPVLLLRNVSERKEGLGHNALLSEFKQKKINYFLQHIDEYKKQPAQFDNLSPSKIIVKNCEKFI